MSSQYGIVPTAEAGDDDEPCSCLQRYLQGGALTPSQKAALASRQPEDLAAEQYVLRLHPESIRQIAYAAFWSMCVLAILLSTTMIPPKVIEESDLKDVFGYNNICVYWDYTPSRELTALYYPLFEYSFLLYVILDHFQFRLGFQSSRPRIVTWAKIALPIKVLLIAWFRMIFVYQVNMKQPEYGEGYGPYIEGALGHTMGFFGLQLALIIVAVENVLYIQWTGVEFPYLGKGGTYIASWLYIVVVTPLTLFKIYVAFTALIGQKIDNFMVIGRVVDFLWMILIALMPLLFAQVGRKTEAHLKITVERDSIAWKDKGP